MIYTGDAGDTLEFIVKPGGGLEVKMRSASGVLEVDLSEAEAADMLTMLVRLRRGC